MSTSESEVFVVVKNDEDQYSIWRGGLKLPLGWYAAGFSGSKEDCLSHIKRVWTDIRPLSLRRSLEAGEQNV